MPENKDTVVPIIDVLPTCYQRKAPVKFVQDVDKFIKSYFKVNLGALSADQQTVIDSLKSRF